MKRKLISALLCLCMVLTLLPMAAMAADFTDTEGNWAENSIDRWAGLGVVNGVGDNKFDPEAGMTRAEFAQTVVNLMKLSGEADLSEFTDIDDDAWYVPAVEAVYAAKIMGGDGTKMDPDGELSREMMFVMIARALGVEDAETCEKTIPDIDKAEDWAVGAINALVNMGVLNGTDALGSVEPTAFIDRAAAVTVLDRMIGGYATEDGQEVTIVPGTITLIVADNVKVKGEADPDLPIVVTGEAKTVDLKEVEGTATVQVNVSDVAVKNAPVGTKVKTLPDAELEDVTLNGKTVTDELTVERPTTPSYTPPSTEPEGDEKTPADYTVIFDATYGTIKADTSKGTLDSTCYGGENDTVANDQKWISIKVNQVTELKLSTYFNEFPFTVTGPEDEGFAQENAFAGWFKAGSDSETGKIAATDAELLTKDLVEFADEDGQIVLSAYWNKAGGTDAGVCYGGENDDNGTYGKGSEELPAEPQEYTIVFDASVYGKMDLKESVSKDPTCWGGENTCWGGENTCWGGENDEQENHLWAVTTVTCAASSTLKDIGPDPSTIFDVTLRDSEKEQNIEFGGWGYLKDSSKEEIKPVVYDKTTIADMYNAGAGKVILIAIWNVKNSEGETCFGGVNDATGNYKGSSELYPDEP